MPKKWIFTINLVGNFENHIFTFFFTRSNFYFSAEVGCTFEFQKIHANSIEACGSKPLNFYVQIATRLVYRWVRRWISLAHIAEECTVCLVFLFIFNQTLNRLRSIDFTFSNWNESFLHSWKIYMRYYLYAYIRHHHSSQSCLYLHITVAVLSLIG